MFLPQNTIVDHFSEGSLKLWWVSTAHLNCRTAHLLRLPSPCAMIVVDKMLWPTLYLTKWSTHDCFLVTFGSMKYSEKKNRQYTHDNQMTWVTGSLTLFFEAVLSKKRIKLSNRNIQRNVESCPKMEPRCQLQFTQLTTNVWTMV